MGGAAGHRRGQGIDTVTAALSHQVTLTECELQRWHSVSEYTIFRWCWQFGPAMPRSMVATQRPTARHRSWCLAT